MLLRLLKALIPASSSLFNPLLPPRASPIRPIFQMTQLWLRWSDLPTFLTAPRYGQGWQQGSVPGGLFSTPDN